MRRYLCILTVWAATASAQPSKTSDTLCFDLPTIRKVLVAAEQGKVLKQQVQILNDRISLLQSKVSTLEAKDSATVASYEAEIKVMREQRGLFEGQIKAYEKLLRRERLKTKAVTMVGVLATGLTILVSMKN